MNILGKQNRVALRLPGKESVAIVPPQQDIPIGMLDDNIIKTAAATLHLSFVPSDLFRVVCSCNASIISTIVDLVIIADLVQMSVDGNLLIPRELSVNRFIGHVTVSLVERQ